MLSSVNSVVCMGPKNAVKSKKDGASSGFKPLVRPSIGEIQRQSLEHKKLCAAITAISYPTYKGGTDSSWSKEDSERFIRSMQRVIDAGAKTVIGKGEDVEKKPLCEQKLQKT